MNLSEQLYRTFELMNEGKEEKAWQIIAKWEKSEHLTQEENHIYKMFKAFILFLTGDLAESLKIVEEHYQHSKIQQNMVNAFDALILKSNILYLRSNIAEMGESVMQSKRMLKSVLQESNGLDFEWRKAYIWLMMGYYLYNINEFDKALKYLNKSLIIFERNDIFSGVLPFPLSALGVVYTGKGELDLALKFHIESLGHSKGDYMVINIVNATSYQNMGEIYFQKGELEHAIEYYEKSVKIWEQFTFPIAVFYVGVNYDSLIKVSLYKDTPERAQEYLDRLMDYLKKRKIDENFYWYKLGKVRIMVSSSRTREQAEAEKILKEFITYHDALIKSGAFTTPIEFGAGIWYLLICDIYLRELRLTNDLTILDDIKPFITRLLKELEHTNSYTLQVQTYLLHGKISLLSMNMGDARQYLTQAQRIAEKHSLQLLAREISAEHDKLLEQLGEWENLKRKKASITERMNLASLDITMDRIQGRRAIEPPELVDEKPILLLIIGQDGISYFNHSFIENWDFNDLFSSFMSAFNTFSAEIFSESIDRIKIGENVILIKPIEPFLVCYVIKGQSYPALLKLTRFSDALKWKSEIWEALNKAVKTSEMLGLNNPSSLGEIVNEIFIL
ncbi:MAG: tetratricopeptide repeat protein [Candidatus Hodarchaeota archaeon]